MGIRVIVIGQARGNDVELQSHVSAALELLRRYDPERMRRVSEFIRVVVLRGAGSAGLYLRTGRICVLNVNGIPPDFPLAERVIAIAGMLVHEATHGILDEKGFPYCGRLANRIERICSNEQTRAVEHIARSANEDDLAGVAAV